MLRWIDVVKRANFGNPSVENKIVKTNDEWKAILSDEQYFITRESGTEQAHSAAMCGLFEPGIYVCICCKTPLFDSDVKYQSGTGWPSFTQPISENAIAYHKDKSDGKYRIEVTCNTCNAHLGHVFRWAKTKRIALLH